MHNTISILKVVDLLLDYFQWLKFQDATATVLFTPWSGGLEDAMFEAGQWSAMTTIENDRHLRRPLTEAWILKVTSQKPAYFGGSDDRVLENHLTGDVPIVSRLLAQQFLLGIEVMWMSAIQVSGDIYPDLRG
jgi:hypothetical protein